MTSEKKGLKIISLKDLNSMTITSNHLILDFKNIGNKKIKESV
jgi:hypothetical protein